MRRAEAARCPGSERTVSEVSRYGILAIEYGLLLATSLADGRVAQWVLERIVAMSPLAETTSRTVGRTVITIILAHDFPLRWSSLRALLFELLSCGEVGLPHRQL